MGQIASTIIATSCVVYVELLEEMKKNYQSLKMEMDDKCRTFLENVYECLSKIAEQADNAKNMQDLIVLVTSISTFFYLLLVSKKVKNFLVELMKVGGTGVGDLEKELQSEIDFVKGKLEEIEQLIHEIENGTHIRLTLLSQNINNESTLIELVKEFNNSVFEIKKRMKECDRQLQISYEKVHDFLRRRRNARVAGIVTAAVGGVATSGFGGLGVVATLVAFSNPVTAAVATVAGVAGAVAGVAAVATGTTIAVLNQDNEEEQRFRTIETNIELSQKQLNEAIDKFKGYISGLQSKNVPIANW